MNFVYSIIIFLSMGAYSQDLKSLLENHLDVTSNEIKETTSRIDISDGYYYSLFVVVGLMMTAVIMMSMVLKAIASSKHHTPQDLVMGSGLIVVVFSTLILVNAATSTEALMAAIGIIGSVTGYVLGHAKKEKDENKRKIQIRKTDKE